MPLILNFRKIEVSGTDKEVAFSTIPFTIQGDATSAYKKWKAKQIRGVNENMMKEFMLNFLATKSRNTPGVGYYITVEKAVPCLKQRPWMIVNHRNPGGPRKMKKTYVLISREDNRILGKAYVNKTNAINLAKEIISEGYVGTIDIELMKTVPQGEPRVASVAYSPSKNTQVGTWICFGIEQV